MSNTCKYRGKNSEGKSDREGEDTYVYIYTHMSARRRDGVQKLSKKKEIA